MSAYKNAVALKPDYAEAYNNWGATLNKLRRYEEAAEVLENAKKSKSNFFEIYNNLGNAYRGLEHYRKATECYQQAIKRNMNSFSAHFYLASIYLEHIKDKQKALYYFRRALQLSTDQSIAPVIKKKIEELEGGA
jgi:tetratricopeptide (TPR) repeat protein